MITARKGDNIIKVSKHSFETMFKDKGYVVVSDEVKEKVETVAEPSIGEETVVKTETEETPISEMNKEQLMEYAKEHGIDTSKARNVREARQIIQKVIREKNME
jgi:lipocalin|nr:MAG TPA: HeH/LEM domain [Caudoviricetes sp.]